MGKHILHDIPEEGRPQELHDL